MRAVVVAVVAFLLCAAPAGAATKLRVSAPASAVAGSTVSVKLSGPKSGKVRLYLLTHPKRRKADRPIVRGSLKRGKATLTLKLSSLVWNYRLIACLDARKLTCAATKRLKTTAKPVLTSPKPAPPAPVPQAPPGRPAANPLTITLAPERGRTASSRIGPAGGSVSATGADGTVFRVTVPAGALATPEDISVTPAGAAALLEPAGLGFAHPADVSIGVTRGDPMAFAVDGSEAFLVPQTFDDAGAVHVALRRFVPVGVTTEDWSARVPTGEADTALHRIAVAKWRWAHGALSLADRDAEWYAALQRWRYAGFAGDFDTATTDLLAWQDAGGSDPALTAANAQALRGEVDRAAAVCDPAATGRLILLAQLDRELGYGVGVDPARCGGFSVKRTVAYAYDTDGYSENGWTYSAGHRSYTTTATGTIAYANGELRAVLRTTAADWQLSRHASALVDDCERDLAPFENHDEGSTPVVLELTSNLGVARTPVLRVTDGAQGITLQGIDLGNGFDCEPPGPILEPSNLGAETLQIGGSGQASAHSFASTPITGSAFARTTVDTAVTLVKL